MRSWWKPKVSVIAAAVAATSLACASGGGQRSSGEYVDDKVVSAKVKAALIDDPATKAYQIDVETYNGVVQLSGFVADKETAMTAEQVAESVQGVRDVKNDLHVRRP
jgi:hyperosmotically inducible protein